jgi:hypothetical protein
MARQPIGKEHPQLNSILAVSDAVRTMTHLSNTTTNSHLKTELLCKIKNIVDNHSDILEDEGRNTAKRLVIELDELQKNESGYLNSNITKLFCDFARVSSKVLFKKY